MTLQIVHTPLGIEHPYEQLPEERSPRRPLAGEPFTVGIVTRPPGMAKTVRVIMQIDNGPPVSVDACRIDDWQAKAEEGVGAEYLERIDRIEQDVWQATLTAPPVGGTLRYHAEADGQQTQPCSIVGETWVRGGGWSVAGDTITFAASALSDGIPLPFAMPRLVALHWLTDGRRSRQVRLTFASPPDEAFYGLGERFNALNQRGSRLENRVFEQYKNQGRHTYLPIPFLLSSAGYGLWADSTRWMQFDLCAADPDAWSLEADLGDDESFHLHCIVNDDPFAMIGQFARQTGPVVLPPLWSFGLWMSGNEWNSQARIEQEVQTSLMHDIQPTVLVIEAWSDETTFYIWNDAQYQPTSGSEALRLADFTFPAESKWPDPKTMIDRLHDQGIRVLLWQIPVMKTLEGAHPQHEADRAHVEAAGFGVREPDGSLHRVRPFWFRGGWLWDVTNPAERDWWLSKRAYLLEDMGIDGFKTDGGEHLWSEDARFADGRTGAEVWNAYPQLYTEAYYQFARQRREAITFSRAGYLGSQRSPLHWAGDENSTWDAFRHSILAGLSAGISGIPFWGWDFGGFSGEIPDAELYLRAAAMAAFCPVMQYHSEFNQHRTPSRDRTPWNIAERTGDARVLSAFRRLLHTRYALLPYIWQEAQHSAATGEPMLRAARLQFRGCTETDYFFGRDLFVSPVVQPGIHRAQVMLPPGTWIPLWEGSQSVEGGQELLVDAPLDRLPVFVRAGVSLPMRLPAGAALGDPVAFEV